MKQQRIWDWYFLTKIYKSNNNMEDFIMKKNILLKILFFLLIIFFIPTISFAMKEQSEILPFSTGSNTKRRIEPINLYDNENSDEESDDDENDDFYKIGPHRTTLLQKLVNNLEFDKAEEKIDLALSKVLLDKEEEKKVFDIICNQNYHGNNILHLLAKKLIHKKKLNHKKNHSYEKLLVKSKNFVKKNPPPKEVALIAPKRG
jgi:hypothetical protein